MERHYVIRKQQVIVEQLDDVIAVKLEDGVKSSEVIRRTFGPTVRQPPTGAAPGDWRAFKRAGWRFVRPPRQLLGQLLAAVTEGGSVPGARSVQSVFVHEDGRLCLGLNRLCLRFANKDLSKKEEIRELLRQAALTPVSRSLSARHWLIGRMLPGKTDLLDRMQELVRSDRFAYVEPEFIEYIPGRGRNSPTSQNQWHLQNVDAPGAWCRTRGEGVRLAVIDNGFQADHPDIEDSLEPSSGRFLDDDESTFDRAPATWPSSDHGTHCAGLAVARGEFGTGVSGIAGRAGLIAVACLEDQIGSQSTLARAIEYAMSPGREGLPDCPGADVISCSLGPARQTWVMNSCLQDAINMAVNEGRGGRGTPVFWAVTDMHDPICGDQVCAGPNTIAVGSCRQNDLRAPRGYGPELDFLAPGEHVLGAVPVNTYDHRNGTSGAAPIAAGIAALILGVKPTLHWRTVREIMRQTCDQIGVGTTIKGVPVTYVNGRNDYYGWGRLNAMKAVKAAEQV